MASRLPPTPTNRLLLLGAILVGLALAGLTYPIIAAAVAGPPPVADAPGPPAVARAALPAYRYEAWYSLPVQEGRTKPLQSACIEAVRQITGRTTFEDLDPVGIVLAWVLTGGAGAGPGCTDWETYPFILCEHRSLRRAIFAHRADGVEGGKYVSPADLRGSPGFDQLVDRASQARKDFGAKAHFHLPEEELRAEETARRLMLYDALCGRASTRLHTNALLGDSFVDLDKQAKREAVPAEEVLRRLEQRSRHPDPLPFPGKEVHEMTAAFGRVREAYRSADAERFEAASEEFFGVLRRTAEELGTDPGLSTIPLELLVNRMQPFRWAWVLMLAAATAFLLSLSWNSRIPYVVGFALAGSSLLVQALGFAARITISGWAPVSNMYETVIFASFMAGLFALVLEMIYRRCVFGLAGAGVATLGLILADGLPLALDPKITLMVPVLRTNYWLTVHVLTIVCGYGAGALAWGLGNLSLALLAFGKGSEGLSTLAKLTYRSMQLTVLLLAAGTFLGGWWADQAWGRFWGWDPKEVGALVALVCYVVPLHARYVGWVKEYGLAVWAVLCFGAILTSWYVLNFVLTAGLHSYGFGAAGGPWVLWAVVANVEWVLVATLLYRARSRSGVETADALTPAEDR